MVDIPIEIVWLLHQVFQSHGRRSRAVTVQQRPGMVPLYLWLECRATRLQQNAEMDPEGHGVDGQSADTESIWYFG